MKKKRIRLKKGAYILFSIIIVLVIGIFSCVSYFNSHKLLLEFDKDINISINERLYNLDNIKVIENGKIITRRRIVNTSKVGIVEVNFEIEDYFKKKSKYKYKVNVYDREKPSISFNKEVEVDQGSEIDLLKDVVVSDNSNEKLNAKVKGKYDLNVPGEYKLTYVARDSSGNECQEEFILKVRDKGKSSISKRENNDNISRTSKGYDIVVKDGVTYIDGHLIANKTYALPKNYGNGLTNTTKANFEIMKKAAKEDGLNIYISSGFRSYNDQKYIYNNYVKNDGRDEADTYSARAGHSEHQSGLAFDVNIINDSFAGTPEAIWLDENCYKYGFILRYPKNKSNETGYKYEPWHFRYVGVDLATILYNDGDWITMENYYGITSEYE